MQCSKLKYLCLSNRKIWKYLKEFRAFGLLRTVLSVSSWAVLLSRFWFPTWVFNYFNSQWKIAGLKGEQQLEMNEFADVGWAWNFILALFLYCITYILCMVIQFLIVDNNDLALIERFSTWWAVRYLVLAFIAFWTGLLSVSLKWTHHTTPWWPETDDLSQIALHSRGLQSLKSTVRLKMNP